MKHDSLQKYHEIDLWIIRQKLRAINSNRGIHSELFPKISKYQGISIAGSYFKRGSKRRRIYFGNNPQTSKRIHKEKLNELRNMKALNFPKETK